MKIGKWKFNWHWVPYFPQINRSWFANIFFFASPQNEPHEKPLFIRLLSKCNRMESHIAPSPFFWFAACVALLVSSIKNLKPMFISSKLTQKCRRIRVIFAFNKYLLGAHSKNNTHTLPNRSTKKRRRHSHTIMTRAAVLDLWFLCNRLIRTVLYWMVGYT